MPFTNGFVGFENYRMLLQDERFWSSLLISLIYTGSTVLLQVVIGLALALLVMNMKRGQGWFRLIAILPVVLSPAVVGMIWRTFMLSPEFGIIDFLNYWLFLIILVLYITYQFFNNIFQSNHPCCTTKLIQNNGNLYAFLFEFCHQVVDLFGFGNKIRLADNVF